MDTKQNSKSEWKWQFGLDIINKNDRVDNKVLISRTKFPSKSKSSLKRRGKCLKTIFLLNLKNKINLLILTRLPRLHLLNIVI